MKWYALFASKGYTFKEYLAEDAQVIQIILKRADIEAEAQKQKSLRAQSDARRKSKERKSRRG